MNSIVGSDVEFYKIKSQAKQHRTPRARSPRFNSFKCFIVPRLGETEWRLVNRTIYSADHDEPFCPIPCFSCSQTATIQTARPPTLTPLSLSRAPLLAHAHVSCFLMLQWQFVTRTHVWESSENLNASECRRTRTDEPSSIIVINKFDVIIVYFETSLEYW